MALQSLRRSNFFIRLQSWEYWPFGILQFPVFFYYFFLSLKSRSLLFFSASNPGIEMGGMFGESKFRILSKIPPEHVAKTFIVKHPATLSDVLNTIHDNGLQLPVIFKPDLGERGHMVRRIHNAEEITSYLKEVKVDFLIQELIDLPFEFGVFYTRLPSEPNGRVTSVVGKEMLSVTGDGVRTLKELILRNPRAKLQWDKLQVKFAAQLNEIIADKEKLELVSIGNHCLGTKFLDRTDLICDQLNTSFDSISRQIPGFYFGRFDLRCASEEDLLKGRVKILELNGCGAEPAHIYQPGFSFWTAMAVLFRHWGTIYRISKENHRRGIPYLSLSEAMTYYRTFKNATR